MSRDFAVDQNRLPTGVEVGEAGKVIDFCVYSTMTHCETKRV
jgi:hypothetical protein